MTVTTTSSEVVCLGNGSTILFAYTFIIPAASDAVITYTDASGHSTILSPTQYAISGIDDPSGGFVQYPLSGSPIASGTSLTIQRILPLVQETSISNQGAFYPESVEAALDYLMMCIQQIQTEVGAINIAAITEAVAECQAAAASASASAATARAAATTASAAAAAAQAIVQSIAPASTTQVAVGGAVQSISTGKPGLVATDVSLYIGGVKQYSDTYSISGTGVITPVGGTWPGDGTTVNAEVDINTTFHVGVVNIDASQITSGTLPPARLTGAYTGITGVGTVTTGIWGATPVAIANGGTAATTAPSALTNLGIGSIATRAAATSAQYRSNTNNLALGISETWAAVQPVALTDAATILVDMSLFINATVTIAADRILGNPSNTKSGQAGYIRVDPGSSNRTLTLGSTYKAVDSGSIVTSVSLTANHPVFLYYSVNTSTEVVVSVVRPI